MGQDKKIGVKTASVTGKSCCKTEMRIIRSDGVRNPVLIVGW